MGSPHQERIVVDYMTSREFATKLEWCTSKRIAGPIERVRGRLCPTQSNHRRPSLIMDPASKDVSVEELISGSRKECIHEGMGAYADPPLMNMEGYPKGLCTK